MAEPVHPVPLRKPFCWIFGEPVYLFHGQTGSELRTQRGLPTAQDLREQARRRIAASEAAASEAAAAAAELDNKNLGKLSGTTEEVNNLNPSASASTTQVMERGGGSFLNKDLGESSGTMLVENLNPAETDLSGTRADLKGKSLLKDLDESSETVDGYLNSAANLTGASSGTRDEGKGKFVLNHPHNDLSKSSETAVDFLTPTADLSAATDAVSGTKAEVKGNSVLKRPYKDLGESTESMVEYLNLAADSSAATDIASVTEAEFEGGSVRKRPRKDLF